MLRRTGLAAMPQDIQFHGGFAWWQARLASSHGTLEIRPCSQQPDDAVMAVAAMGLGLVENLKDAYHLYKTHSLAEWRRLRFDVLRHGLRASILDRPVLPLVRRMLEIARTGFSDEGWAKISSLRFLKIEHRQALLLRTPFVRGLIATT